MNRTRRSGGAAATGGEHRGFGDAQARRAGYRQPFSRPRKRTMR